MKHILIYQILNKKFILPHPKLINVVSTSPKER